MSRRILVSAAAAAAFGVSSVLAACGSSSSGGNAPSDGGASDASSMSDSSVGDGGGNMAGDGGLPEGAVPPQGTQLVMGASITALGVTTDNFAVYSDGTANTVNAVSVAGGSPANIGMAPADVLVSGPAVLDWIGTNQTTGAATFSIWTSAHGVKPVGTAVLDSLAFGAGPGQGLVDVSSDGTHVLYFDNLTTTTADLDVINTDGTGKTTLVSGVRFDNQQCFPFAAFAGSDVVAAYCTGAPADAGVPEAGPPVDAGLPADAGAPTGGPATLTAFSGASWATTTTISTTAQPTFVSDKAGTKLLFTEAGGFTVYDLASAMRSVVPGAASGLFSSDGMTLVFLTTGGDLDTAPVATPATATTLASGFKNLLTLSPDDKWALLAKTVNQMTGIDLYLASATTAGTPATLSSMATVQFFGDPFTTDSSHAVWNQNVDTTAGTGDIYAAPTSGPSAMPSKLGTGVWINASTTGAKIVFNANCNNCSNAGPGTADLEGVDLAAGTTPKLLVTQADGNFFVTSDKTKVVYSWNYAVGPLTGLWVIPAP